MPVLTLAVLMSLQSAPRPAVPRPITPQAPRPTTARPAPAPAPLPRTFFTSPYALEAMRGKQAVMETTAGTVVIQLIPDAAPNHVGLFMKLAADNSYVGTAFHRVIANGIIQGGDPLSKDPAK